MDFIYIDRAQGSSVYRCHAAAGQTANCQFYTPHPDADPDTTACEWFGIDLMGELPHTCHSVHARNTAIGRELNAEATS